MADMSAIVGLATSLRSITEIAKAMKDVHDANVIQTKVFELTREIMSAQACALAAQAAQSDLLQRERNLETEISTLKAWDAEKQRYELKEVSANVFAYVPKSGMESGEPFHMLCANCYQRGQKSILQATQELRMRRRVHYCPHCKSEFEMTYVERPDPPPVNREPPSGSWGGSRRG
jgi:hypothetical protein